MKKTSKIFILGILLCLNFHGYSQEDVINPYPDTLTLTTDNQVALTFALYQMSDKEDYFSNELWKGMLNTMASAIESSEYFEGIIVSYANVMEGEEEVARIAVRPFDKVEDVYLIGKDGIKEKPADRIEFQITLPKVAVSFYLQDLDQLEEIKEANVESVWDQISRKYENYGLRDVYTGSGLLKYGNANIESITSKRLTTDALELSAGLGLGFIRDRFVPDFSAKVAVQIPDRLGNKKSEVGLLYTQHIFYEAQPENEYRWDSNGFLSGVYKRTFLSDYEIGLSAGVLVLRNGDHFKGDTYKFSLYTSGQESNFSIAPELIVTDSFKQAIPVIRIGFSF